VDAVRPMVSGLMCDSHYEGCAHGGWGIRDHAETVDMLCTHPYPYFTPYSLLDGSVSLRTLMNAPAVSALHADLGGKPCLIEEINTLGPMHSSMENIAKFLRVSLLTSVALGFEGLLWWCGFDLPLNYKPYDWVPFESELGMLNADRSDKVYSVEFRKLAALISEHKLADLPPAKRLAVCVLTPEQNQWEVVYAAWMLAAQAGYFVRFTTPEDDLPEAGLYLVPSLSGQRCLNRPFLNQLLSKAESGADVYMSMGHGVFLPDFTDITGLELLSVTERKEIRKVFFEGQELPIPGEYRYDVRNVDSRILAEDDKGVPVFVVKNHGQGKIFTLTVGLEGILCKTGGALSDMSAPDFSAVYRAVGEKALAENLITKNKRLLIIFECGETVYAVNCTDAPLEDTLEIKRGYKLEEVIYGEAKEENGKINLGIPPAGAVVLRLTNNSL